LRAALSHDAGRSRIEISAHHVIADRRSFQAILGSLATAYTEGSAPARQAASFLQAMAAMQPSTDDVRRAREFWTSRLPASHQPQSPAGPLRVRRVHARCAPVAPTDGATRHAVMLWALRRALDDARMPQPDLIGVDVDLRSPGAADSIGPYSHSLPVVVPGPGEARAGARQVMAATAQVLAHASVALSDIQPPVPMATGDPRQPFYRYKLVFQTDTYPPLRFASSTARYLALPPGIAENSVTVFARDEGASLAMDLAWDTRVADEQAARALLARVIAHAHEPGGGRP
jgi:hypothetical protein